ncbi:hypothetical protein Bca101_046919 [Brassica carinata]
MGNGHLPTKHEKESARIENVEIIDSQFKAIGSRKYKLEKLLDSNKCYGLRAREDLPLHDLFTYGGPGGDSFRCRETARNSKSVNEKIIYDCVDIYKQPSLTHPLLQNHKIQMEPSFIISKQKDQTKTKSESKKFIDCPNGTVPILKNTKEFVTNAQYWANKHFNSFTIDSHGTHFAGVRASQDQGPYHGVEAWMSVHELNISVDQTSYTNIYVASAVSDKVNFIQTGWMDKETGNWWAADVKYNGHGMNIGYWPKELFDLISTNAGMVGVTGAVQASLTREHHHKHP